MPHVNEMFPGGRYLKRNDVEPPVVLTISSLEEVQVGNPPEPKWALYFAETDRPLILNAINARTIAQLSGSEETDDWPGLQVTLYFDPNVEYDGQTRGGIRVRAPHPNELAGAATQGDPPPPTPRQTAPLPRPAAMPRNNASPPSAHVGRAANISKPNFARPPQAKPAAPAQPEDDIPF
jgi:hypothetical protein